MKDLLTSINEAEDNPDYQHYIDHVPEEGIWLEFGVSSGATFRRFAEYTTKPFYGFDCWEGLPEDWLTAAGIARHAKGEFRSGPPTDLPSHCVLVSGLFEDSLPKFCKEHKDLIAFVHIDCDLYSSTKTIFDNLKDRFQDGAVIMFDEICGYDGWEIHEYKAFNEFLEETKYKHECLGKYGTHQMGFKIYK